ncbi:MAG: hypothetical protein BWY72_02257 [Bacteroidetes bacterium ADurb.Bin416]|nr:MAG: hypothetical protein BWY72_02257 [Bacteroidetes bacterium ADurb.Bin416]
MNAVFERLGQLVLFNKAVQDGFLALIDVLIGGVGLGNLFNLHFVKAACAFLTIAADKGYRGSVFQETDGVSYIVQRQLQVVGDELYKCFLHTAKIQNRP